MRDLNSEEQQCVAGGLNASNDLIGWVPSNVLFALQTGAMSIGPGAITMPIRLPGLIPGPGAPPALIPTTLMPGGLPYDC